MNQLPKKKIKKNSLKRTTQKQTQISTYYIRYLVIPTIILVSVLTAKLIIKTYTNPVVLGASTYLLADTGDSENKADNPTKDSQNDTKNMTIENTSKVDCTGPDGKHFQSSYNDCKVLNQSWHHTDFSFTPLSESQKDSREKIGSIENKRAAVQQDSTAQQIEIKSEGNHQQVEVQKDDTKIIFSNENNNLEITAEASASAPIKLEKSDAFEKINNILKEKGITISTSSANHIVIKDGDTVAKAQLPLAVIPQTGNLTITTPAGEKQVAILPEQAVNSLIENKIVNSIQAEATDSNQIATASANIDNTIMLTLLNNQPVFAINGLSNKKLLGIVPMQFAKTIYVSTETGQILKTNETPLTKFLESFSF